MVVAGMLDRVERKVAVEEGGSTAGRDAAEIVGRVAVGMARRVAVGMARRVVGRDAVLEVGVGLPGVGLPGVGVVVVGLDLVVVLGNIVGRGSLAGEDRDRVVGLAPPNHRWVVSRCPP